MSALTDAIAIAGPIGFPSKMPGTSYGISAHACITGAKLAKVPGSVCEGCYALGGNYVYPSVLQAHKKRLAGIAHPQWTSAMVTLLRHAHARGTGRNGAFAVGWHRWHDSGDLQSVEHLTKICAVAALTPEIRHWLPTREMGIVARYRAQGGTVPDNLLIRVSATMVDGPATKAWDTTSGVHDAKAPPAGTHVCPAPTQGNACGACRACWSRDVAHVSYHRH
jgi:Gene product 88